MLRSMSTGLETAAQSEEVGTACVKSEFTVKDEHAYTTIPEEDISDDPELAEEHIRSHLLPEKTRSRYEDAYKKFMDWRKKSKVTSFSEEVLLAYFNDLSKILKSSSLVSRYFRLKTTLSIKYNLNISKYRELRDYIRRVNAGYAKKKLKKFTAEEIQRFLENAPDKAYLLVKTIFIIGISGACTKHELRNIKPEDIVDTGTSLIITIKNTKTESERSFSVSGNYYTICKKYMDLRPRELTNSDAFFLKYVNGLCTRDIIGINKIGTIPKEIARHLRIPDADDYSGHCFMLNATDKLGALGVSARSYCVGDESNESKPNILCDNSVSVDKSNARMKSVVMDLNNANVTINNKGVKSDSGKVVSSIVVNDDVAEILNPTFVFNNCTVVINNYN